MAESDKLPTPTLQAEGPTAIFRLSSFLEFNQPDNRVP